MIRPRILSLPAKRASSSLGREAVDLAAHAGLILDPWQQQHLRASLSISDDGLWCAFSVGLNVSRQNGKGGVLEGRELAGLFLAGERMITHSAHQFDTSLDAFRRLEELIQNTPDLHKRVKPRGYKHSHGEEGIELKTGQRIRFRTRTSGGGRGFSSDLVIFDEAMIIREEFVGALLPTLAARENPQVWYTGSAVDQIIHEHGRVFARVRERGIAGTDERLLYAEYSVDAADPDKVTAEMASDPRLWAQANPAFEIRITEDYIRAEQLELTPRTFAVERLGVGDWPAVAAGAEQVIDAQRWEGIRDARSAIAGAVCFGFDVSPARTSASIAAGGRRGDGLAHVELTGGQGGVDHRPGTGWVVGRLVELTDAHAYSTVICDGSSPAAALIPDLEAAGVKVETLTSTEFARACGSMLDMVNNRSGRHLGQPELDRAVAAVGKRPVGDAFAWSRRTSEDITPMCAATAAHWGAVTTDAYVEPIAVWR